VFYTFSVLAQKLTRPKGWQRKAIMDAASRAVPSALLTGFLAHRRSGEWPKLSSFIMKGNTSPPHSRTSRLNTRRIRVLFHVTHLRRGGGIESSLMSWLNIMDRELFSVGLSIAYPTEDIEAVFRAQIPADTALHMLGPEAWLSHCRQLKMARKLKWPGLIYEELLLPQVRKRVFAHRVERIAADYDVVIDYDLSLVRFCPGLGKPLLGVRHFNFPAQLRDQPRKYRSLAHYFQRYDALIAISHAMEEEGRALFPMMADRIAMLYPGLDHDAIRRRAAQPAAGLPAGPYIVSVTRLEETQKDVSTLIRAYALLVHAHQVAETLLLVGDGRHQGELERLARELGVRDRITFLGFTPNPLPYMRHAQLMVLSSKFEGLPTVLIEGLILGKVLVSTDCPTGPREILDDGRAGLLTPVGDAPALAAAMLQGLRDQDLRARLADAALRHAGIFSVDAFRRGFHGLLKQLGILADSLPAEEENQAAPG
jgi:glycosyltransferase involved in cell wall biosynthesis